MRVTIHFVQKFKIATLFATGFIQVFFVAINVLFLSKELYLGVMVSSFMISLVWSYNVKKIAFGSIRDRVIYSLGAATGSLVGLYVSSLIYNLN